MPIHSICNTLFLWYINESLVKGCIGKGWLININTILKWKRSEGRAPGSSIVWVQGFLEVLSLVKYKAKKLPKKRNRNYTIIVCLNQIPTKMSNKGLFFLNILIKKMDHLILSFKEWVFRIASKSSLLNVWYT